MKTQLRSPGRLPAAEGSQGGLGGEMRLRGAIKKTTVDVGFLAQVKQGKQVKKRNPTMEAKLQLGCDCLGMAEVPLPVTLFRLLSLAPRKRC